VARPVHLPEPCVSFCSNLHNWGGWQGHWKGYR
jgi:hypothetical protein